MIKKNSATFKRPNSITAIIPTVTIPMFPSILKFLKQNRDH
jgi:hypothetical protein